MLLAYSISTSRYYFMKNPKVSYILVAVALLASSVNAHAKPKLPGFFTDNMVLQRDKPVPVWGWDDPGATVTVSFGGQTKQASTDALGKWAVSLDAMPANAQPQVLSVNDTEIRLNNVVIGDVWICSGQSNMEWLVNNALDPAGEIAKVNTSLIRQMKVQHLQGDLPVDDVNSIWAPSNQYTVGGFTAVGYYFARRLHEALDVPIGLISANWSGTRIEPWIPPLGYRMVPELAELRAQVDQVDLAADAGRANHIKAFQELSVWAEQAAELLEAGSMNLPEKPKMPTYGQTPQDPTRLYNEMIHPLVPFAIRGVIWYQGESNGTEGDSYYHKKQALVGSWRSIWGQGDFPFYWVQLANFQAVNNNPAGGDGWARAREAQLRSLEIPNTGMAVTIDIGHPTDIHPKNKQDVGSRLAQWALAKEYDQAIVPSGPLYQSMAVEGTAIRVTFDHIGQGLMAGKKEILKPYEPVESLAPDALKCFTIAGADRVWHWAEARVDGHTVVVSSPQVAAPVAVRYAFSMNPDGANLYNKEGLPASPFRTDTW